MKYKLIAVMACLCSLLFAVSISWFSGRGDHRYHQHLETEEKQACDHEEDLLCTHLPLVVIDTAGEEIPGRLVYETSETGERVARYTTTAEGLSEIVADISVIDNEETNNHITDTAALRSDIRIHVRGNSSRAFDKTGYSVRLVDSAGVNNPQSIMGMDAHHEWTLHGPFLDKTLLRNYMWYNIAGEVMDYAPNVRFCEVVLNGEYQGLYLMTETITAGSDGTRLDLSVNKKDNTFSGYLLRLDRGSDFPLKNIASFSRYTLRTDMILNIEYPGNTNLTAELAESIRQDFSDFEKMLYSFDYDNTEYGYENYLDRQSFVDYFLLNEITCNYDAGWLSTYIYKDVDGKYRMCVWDFNSACDGYETPVDPHHFEMQNCLWYVMLMKDADFTENIISRYRELRKTCFSDDYLNSYIDGTVHYLGDAIQRNYEVWGYSLEEERDILDPTERNPRYHEEAIQDLKTFLEDRLSWLDENIEVLQQYSADSRTKKFNEHSE